MDAVMKKGYNDHHKALLFWTAAALRTLLAIVFPTLPDLLTGRVEISTPVNSFKRLQEGLFLYERGLDPYDGGIFHQAPLLLPLFALLPSPTTWLGRILSVCLYTGLDIGAASSLLQIATSAAAYKTRDYQSPRSDLAWPPVAIAAVYLLNPFTITTCLARPTTVFTTFFILLSISHACQAKTTSSAFALAIASYISLHPAFLLPPIALLAYDSLCMTRTSTSDPQSSSPDQKPGEAAFAKPPSTKSAPDLRTRPKPLATYTLYTLTFLAASGLLLALSRLLLPSWQFLPSTYLTPLQLPDLTPNPGLWWYFFIEIFDPFRSFFLGVFWLHMLSYSIPVSLRLGKQPLAAVVVMWGVTVVFEPYANVGAAGAWLASLCLLGHTFELATTHRYTFPALIVLLYATFLGPAFHHLWLYAGSGNANFFYAITLVWNLGLLVLLTDTVYAVLRDEWESERPEGKGKDVRQI